MKCDCCNQKVSECSDCKKVFNKGEEVICEDEEHFCDGECYITYFDLGTGVIK